MVRLACVSVPQLPLQLLLRRHPQWRAYAVAVVPDQKVRSRMLFVNGPARRRGLRAGMRYAAGLSLAGDLRAEAVPAAQVAAGVRALTARLRRFSPHVEPSREEPGVFWLDGAGLHRLFSSPQAWVTQMQRELHEAGFAGAVVAGCTRFGSYALARSGSGARVYGDARQEGRAAAAVSLQRLGLHPRLLDALRQLGVATVRGLLALPATELLARFGPEAYRLHRFAASAVFAAGTLAEPLQPLAEPHPVQEKLLLEYAEADAARLLFLIKAPFHALLQTLAGRRESLKALHFRFLLEGETPLEFAVRPAAPTRETLLLLDLVRLRLEGLDLAAGVVGIDMLAEGAPSEVEQLSLFDAQHGRDLAAGERALARLRAEFGDGAVVRACLREGHLPEARFCWEPLHRLRPPAPPHQAGRRLVRRFFARPRPLSRQSSAPVPGELGHLLGTGPLRGLQGPYTLSGGWWAAEQQRDYYFAETGRGELLWVYHDRRRGRWYQQGQVE